MNKNRKLFCDIMYNMGISCYDEDLQRHYRFWMKSTDYKNMSDEELYTSVQKYIRNNLLPEPDFSPDLDNGTTLMSYGILFTPNELKQCKALGIEFKDTIQGYHISLENSALMRIYTHNYLSLLDVFSLKTGIDNESSMEYRDFLKRCRAMKIELIPIPFHDGEGKLFFHKELSDKVNRLLAEWIACRGGTNDTVPDGCLSLTNSAELLKIDIYTMYEFACAHKEEVKMVSDYIFPLMESVDRWRSNQYESRPLNNLIEKIRKEFKYISKEQAMEAVQKLIIENGPTWIYTGQNLAGKNKNDWYYSVNDENKVRDVVCKSFDDLSVFPVSVLQPITGYFFDELTGLVTKNLIKADETCDGYLVNRNEIMRIMKFRDNLISLKEVLAQIVKDTDSLFEFNSAKCREDLYSFIEFNDFWDIEFFQAGEIPIKPCKSKYFVKRVDELNLRHRLILWTETYGLQNAEKIEILLRHYENLYPETCQSLKVYFSCTNNSGFTSDDKAVVDMISALLPLLGTELLEMSEDEIQEIIEVFRECSLISCQCLTNFLFDSGYTRKRYEFDRTEISIDTSAYPLKAFALMAYSALNNESWTENQLISKAVHNKRYAALWLFIALHFMAAWRSTDFERLQAPTLQYSAEETLTQIEEGTYKEGDAKIVALRFRSQIELSSLKPNKTSNYQNIPELHFFCPQSCEYPMGVILSIAAAHFEMDSKESQFVRCVNDVRTIRTFFGNEFLDACDKRQFSTRRANKSLMQSVETISDTGEKKGLPRPYILASLMRSHKGGYGALAESTAIYLRDANFSGHTPEFIAKQMFERGVCSFVANELMKISFGTDYQELSVPAQTQMIKAIGLTAGEIESIVRICQKAEDEAIALVRDLLGSEDNKETANNILKSMLIGDAAGKDFGSICVLRASGHNCMEPCRLGCLGCSFEIKSKALLLHYVKEHSRISKELGDKSIKSNSIELERRKHINDNVIYPAIVEILVTLESSITSDELKEYRNIVEEALHHGD